MVKAYLIAHGHTEQSVEQLPLHTKFTLITMFGSGMLGPVQSMLNNYRSISMLNSIQSVVIKGLGGKSKNRMDMADTHRELYDMIAPKKTLYDKLQDLRAKWYGNATE